MTKKECQTIEAYFEAKRAQEAFETNPEKAKIILDLLVTKLFNMKAEIERVQV